MPGLDPTSMLNQLMQMVQPKQSQESGESGQGGHKNDPLAQMFHQLMQPPTQAQS
jgi:hypothetical protein